MAGEMAPGGAGPASRGNGAARAAKAGPATQAAVQAATGQPASGVPWSPQFLQFPDAGAAAVAGSAAQAAGDALAPAPSVPRTRAAATSQARVRRSMRIGYSLPCRLP